MNVLASISFAFLFLIKGMTPGMNPGCELQKLPNLFEHYQEHKACNDNSFLKFLVNDYLNFNSDPQSHKDDSDHENLPFHSSSHQCCSTLIFYTSDQPFSLTVLEFGPQVKFGYYSSFHLSEFLDSPFQPPRFNSTTPQG